MVMERFTKRFGPVRKIVQLKWIRDKYKNNSAFLKRRIDLHNNEPWTYKGFIWKSLITLII